MECVFIGTPCREEIELHLRNKRYSLLNNAGLKNDIVRRRISEMSFPVSIPDTSEVEDVGCTVGAGVNKAELEFELSTNLMNSEFGTEAHDVASVGRVKRRASITSKRKVKVDTYKRDTDIPDVEPEMMECETRNTKDYRRLLSRNTSRNSGYKFVMLSLKDGQYSDAERKMNGAFARKHRRKVRFARNGVVGIHNVREPSSILLHSDGPNRIPNMELKEVVPVESLHGSESVDGNSS